MYRDEAEVTQTHVNHHGRHIDSQRTCEVCAVTKIPRHDTSSENKLAPPPLRLKMMCGQRSIVKFPLASFVGSLVRSMLREQCSDGYPGNEGLYELFSSVLKTDLSTHDLLDGEQAVICGTV